MFTDPAFSSRAAVDKRGRSTKREKKGGKGGKGGKKGGEEEEEGEGNAEARRYYHLPSAAGDGERGAGAEGAFPPGEEGGGASSDDEEAAEAEGDPAAAAAARRWARARGLGSDASSSSSEDDEGDDDDGGESASSSSDSEAEKAAGEGEESDEEDTEAAAIALEFGIGACAGGGARAGGVDEDVPLVEDASCRLAIVDCDWDRVRAVDLLALLRSFAPPPQPRCKGGAAAPLEAVQKVAVFVSDYGRERLREEDARGPAPLAAAAARRAARRRAKEEEEQEEKKSGGGGKSESESDDDDDDEDEDIEAAPLPPSSSSDDDEENAEADDARLRAYERSRLRYFYAVAFCDSPQTASMLYTECDGREYLKSARPLDVRFLPDGDEGDRVLRGREVRDEASEVPRDYEPADGTAAAASAGALQHTRVRLS